MSSSESQNPLRLPLLSIIRQRPDGCSEWQLIEALRAEGWLEDVSSGDADLTLFRIHFLVMNALYCLQQELLPEGWYLHVSALHVCLSPVARSDGAMPVCDSPDALRDYYLDLREFERTDGDAVRALLGSFWERFLARDDRSGALRVLGLEERASHEEIRLAYRRLAAEHHPDRGGDPVRFMQVREAWEACLRAGEV